jgi:lipoprotein-anchoring transpeptidase ErfK/SrfK
VVRVFSRKGALGLLAAAGLLAGGGAFAFRSSPPPPAAAPSFVSPSTSAAPQVAAFASPPPDGLPVIDYWTAPRGFPADPTPSLTTAATEGLHPTKKLAVYDAPGGKPKAMLPPTISKLPVIVPIVNRRTGWVAVLLPTANRRIGWLPAKGWVKRELKDHLLVQRNKHKLTWYRDGAERASWTVATGTSATPTPLGRTFVLGRTGTRGAVYAGVDALALGSVPDDKGSVAESLQGAHTGIHGWSNPSAFGRSVSNGCVRMPREAQKTLLKNIGPGTLVTVVD